MPINLFNTILHVAYQHRYLATVSNHDFIDTVAEWMENMVCSPCLHYVPVQS